MIWLFYLHHINLYKIVLQDHFVQRGNPLPRVCVSLIASNGTYHVTFKKLRLASTVVLNIEMSILQMRKYSFKYVQMNIFERSIFELNNIFDTYAWSKHSYLYTAD